MDIIALHKKVHPDHKVDVVILSNDGVSPFRSSSISLNVYSVRFGACKETYPIMIFHPTRACRREVVSQETLNRRILADFQ